MRPSPNRRVIFGIWLPIALKSQPTSKETLAIFEACVALISLLPTKESLFMTFRISLACTAVSMSLFGGAALAEKKHSPGAHRSVLRPGSWHRGQCQQQPAPHRGPSQPRALGRQQHTRGSEPGRQRQSARVAAAIEQRHRPGHPHTSCRRTVPPSALG
jgi:hypothetical protein